jgi:selenocysteine-specific elongation factor
MRVVATAGHVDHGKSALLQRLTGMEPDRWEQERRRGLTIDLGFVWADLDDEDGQPLTVAFVDVPGHDQFVPNMLSGVGVVDRVLFVVAADDGWSAQSEEHLQIIELLERQLALVVITKADLAGEARTAETVELVRDRLASSSLAEAPVLAADSVSGRGLDQVAATLATRLRAAPGGDTTADPRLWVDRSFTVAGAGTVVTGLLETGTLERGQHVAVLGPGGGRGRSAGDGREGRVRGLQSLGREVEVARAGERVAVNLAGVGHERVGRGDVVVATEPDGTPRGLVSDRLDVTLRALPHASIIDRGAWHLHVGTASTTVRIRPLLGEIDESGFAQLHLDVGLPVRHGDRFVLRDVGRRHTAGGGVVLDAAPAPRPRGTEGRLAHALVLEDLAGADDLAARVATLVEAHGGVRALRPLRAGLGRELGEAATADGLVEVEGHLVRESLLATWIEAVAAAAAAAPSEHAVAAADLGAAAVAEGCPQRLASPVVERAVTDGWLVSHGGRYVHHEADASYLTARAERQRRLVVRIETDPWNPPDPDEAATEVGLPAFELRALLDDGELVSCGPLLFTAVTVERAIELLREGPGRDGAGFTAADAKEAWGTTRRAALPLLEHLRATRVTEFDGTEHRLR